MACGRSSCMDGRRCTCAPNCVCRGCANQPTVNGGKSTLDRRGANSHTQKRDSGGKFKKGGGKGKK